MRAAHSSHSVRIIVHVLTIIVHLNLCHGLLMSLSKRDGAILVGNEHCLKVDNFVSQRTDLLAQSIVLGAE